MMKNYFFLCLVFCLISLPLLGNAQLMDSNKTLSGEIEELSIFPNPTTSDKLFITSKHNLPKTIEIYDVLGNKVISTSVLGKSINISKLAPGLYILKIKENELSATRKLVVR
ncbi:T9SS type A sorting domain-containing protein [Psychroserpens mesophilus]|uniref:T9SS type A sorting domain-containing protein n=1 Tax=Psychroserpens mesophilus TaxID=325473 RepID=UPI001F4CB0FB|nr:T9SS type A sorting domain-containing protein [Psychroserpens mesophilus]